jgi:hypothetical protein
MSHRQIVELVAELAPEPNAPATIRRLPTRKTNASPGAARQPGAEGTESRVLPPSSDRALEGDTAQRFDATAEAGDATPPEGDGRPDTELCARIVGESGGELRPAGVGASPVRAGASPVHGGASPDRAGASPVHAPRHRPAIEPVAPARFRVRFDASAEFRDKLERLQALTRSAVPDGDLARVIELAVTRELERLEARRFGKTKKPRKSLAATDTRPRSRHIPAAVRRVVEERDGGRCTHRDRKGRRCPQRHDLEFHHRKPFALGGEHSPKNICLMCRVHNHLAAEHDYGKEVIARHRRSARSVPEAPAGCAIRALSGPP